MPSVLAVRFVLQHLAKHCTMPSVLTVRFVLQHLVKHCKMPSGLAARFVIQHLAKHCTMPSVHTVCFVLDPCRVMTEGDYAMDEAFQVILGQRFDPLCFFVKCANYMAHVNPCSPGTRNDERGGGFCSHSDTAGHCSYIKPHRRYDGNRQYVPV